MGVENVKNLNKKQKVSANVSHVCARARVGVCVGVCWCVLVYKCVIVCVCVCLYVSVCVCVCVRAYACMYACMRFLCVSCNMSNSSQYICTHKHMLIP